MKPKILVVEDDKSSCYLAQFLLERDGFEVKVSVNGKEALIIARLEPPDLIVLDILMPEMDGYETAKRLRGDPLLGHIALVAVSSYAMAGDRALALEAGFDGYIEKPINPDTFAQEIRNFLR